MYVDVHTYANAGILSSNRSQPLSWNPHILIIHDHFSSYLTLYETYSTETLSLNNQSIIGWITIETGYGLSVTEFDSTSNIWVSPHQEVIWDHVSLQLLQKMQIILVHNQWSQLEKTYVIKISYFTDRCL